MDMTKQKSLAGKPYIAVSPYPNRSAILDANKFSAIDIAKFIGKNSDIINEPGHMFGAWVDGGKIYLDVAVAIPKSKMSQAISLAKEFNQKAVFDLLFSTVERQPLARDMPAWDVTGVVRRQRQRDAA